ncbi:hypothetical protein NDU88_010484, partial [Pleurodeles waltl]
MCTWSDGLRSKRRLLSTSSGHSHVGRTGSLGTKHLSGQICEQPQHGSTLCSTSQ